jgi:hypothetical protein
VRLRARNGQMAVIRFLIGAVVHRGPVYPLRTVLGVPAPTALFARGALPAARGCGARDIRIPSGQ